MHILSPIGIAVVSLIAIKKSQIDFEFIYPLAVKKVDIFRPGGYRYDHVTDLVIKGVGSKFEGFTAVDPIFSLVVIMLFIYCG